MNDEITYIKPTELSFFEDLKADFQAGKIGGHATIAVRDADGNEAIKVWLDDCTYAIADGTRFAESDWEECGRLEVHAPEMSDALDNAAFNA